MIDFGVIVCCSSHDYLLAGGLIESIKISNPDVPICVMFDKDIPIDWFIAIDRSIIFIDVRLLEGSILLNYAQGWGLTKLFSFSHSPFEHFLIFDADIIISGKIPLESFKQFDFFCDLSDYSYTKDEIKRYFFDLEKLKSVESIDFNWDYYYDRLFVSGWWYSKKFIFQDAELLHYIKLQNSDKLIFFPGEMGFLNYLANKKEYLKELNIGRANYQKIILDYSKNEQVNLFLDAIYKAQFRIFHYAGISKPLQLNNDIYFIQPFIYFILKFCNRTNENFDVNDYFKLSSQSNTFYINKAKKNSRFNFMFKLFRKLFRK